VNVQVEKLPLTIFSKILIGGVKEQQLTLVRTGFPDSPNTEVTRLTEVDVPASNPFQIEKEAAAFLQVRPLSQ
jgi:hypothetical protein